MLSELAPVLASIVGPNPIVIMYPAGVPDALPAAAGSAPAILLLGALPGGSDQIARPAPPANDPPEVSTPAESDLSATPSEPAPKAARARVASTPAATAQAIFAAEGDVSHDRDTWVKRTGISRRRLDRAIRLGLIPTTRQGRGRANRREFAKASDVARVLATIEAVQQERISPPEWFEAVIRPFKASDAVAA